MQRLFFFSRERVRDIFRFKKQSAKKTKEGRRGGGGEGGGITAYVTRFLASSDLFYRVLFPTSSLPHPATFSRWFFDRDEARDMTDSRARANKEQRAGEARRNVEARGRRQIVPRMRGDTRVPLVARKRSFSSLLIFLFFVFPFSASSHSCRYSSIAHIVDISISGNIDRFGFTSLFYRGIIDSPKPLKNVSYRKLGRCLIVV